MGAHINEKGILTFDTLTMKKGILEQLPVKEIKDVQDAGGGTTVGYTSQEWYICTTPDGEKIYRMRSSDLQNLMWQQLTKQYTPEEYKTRYTEIHEEFKSRWAALRAQLPQIFIV